MPQTKSAKKALHASERRRVINDRWRRKYRAAVKAVKDALKDGKKKEVPELLVDAQKNLDRAARRNILHPNKAARIKSQLQKASNSK